MEINTNRNQGRRKTYSVALLIIIAAGVLSRIGHTGNILLDKYLGDALYAVMIYLFFRLATPSTTPMKHFCIAIVLAGLIEAFQLTGIPLAMRESENGIAQIASIALGTKFGVGDLLAYTLGLVGVFVGDSQLVSTFKARCSCATTRA